MYRRNASSLTDSSQNNSYLKNKSMRPKKKVSRVVSRLSRPRAVASRSARNKKRSRVLKRALMLATAGAGTYYAFTRKNDNTTTPPPSTLMTSVTPVQLSPLLPLPLVSAEAAKCKDTTHLVLQNHGNTCYINASVQLLYQIDEIRDFICDYDVDTDPADAFMSILKSTFTNKKIENSIGNIISDKFSDPEVRYNSITGKQVKIEFLPGETEDAQELLGKIFEFTVLGQIGQINSIGCSLQEELEFIVWHTEDGVQDTLQLLHKTSEYKVVAATDDYTDYTTFRKVKKEISETILTVPVTTDKTSMQHLLADLQSHGNVNDLVVAEYKNVDNKPVVVRRQGTTRTVVVKCKKWIIISLHKQIRNLKLDDATVYNNITLDDKQYTLEGCIQHLGCHYKYHKRLGAEEWLTFNDSITEATRADQIASSYVFLYKQVVE
jgi:hypothetical protein